MLFKYTHLQARHHPPLQGSINLTIVIFEWYNRHSRLHSLSLRPSHVQDLSISRSQFLYQFMHAIISSVFKLLNCCVWNRSSGYQILFVGWFYWCCWVSMADRTVTWSMVSPRETQKRRKRRKWLVESLVVVIASVKWHYRSKSMDNTLQSWKNESTPYSKYNIWHYFRMFLVY